MIIMTSRYRVECELSAYLDAGGLEERVRGYLDGLGWADSLLQMPSRPIGETN